MKVGIITIFDNNYGNKLQNLAVQKLLEMQGCEAETIIVDVKCGIRKPIKMKQKWNKLKPSYIFKAFQQRFKNKYLYKNSRDGIIGSIKFVKNNNVDELYSLRAKSFEGFIMQNLKIADFKLTLDDMDDPRLAEYDYFIVGSDQVWNPTYPHTSCINFLTFAPEYKRIAFAPSIGLSVIPEYVKSVYSKWITKIPNLSVREEKGAEIIKELTGRDATVLADPTLCVSKEEWEMVEKKPDFDISEPYVFTYFLGNETHDYRTFIEKYAKKNNYAIINTFDLREPEHYSVNPAEFVYLIHNAKMVFTDSFHGTVFSLVMHTPFVVFDRIENGGKGMSSRIDTLLNTFLMNNRHYNVINKEEIDCVDFSNVNSIIENLKAKTDLFLKNALQNHTIEKENKFFVDFLKDKSDCSGCHACYNACPRECITMDMDSEGFLYPIVNLDECVHCNICKNACPAVNNNDTYNQPKAYVGFNNNSYIRKFSSSGGVFTVLAEEMLKNKATVYGAAFDDDYEVEHIGVNTKEGLEKLRTSKYVQSKIGETYKEVKDKLSKDEYVFFTGTPCQIEGLYTYLGKQYDKLFTQDIICHGVPSPNIWNEYLNYMSNGNNVKSVSFRDKKFGWHYFSMRIITDKSNYVKRLDQDVFTRLFLDNTILRPSCYNCKYKRKVRISDFTLADCWRPSKVESKLKDDDKGLSMIFVNSEKGKILFNLIKADLTYQEIDYNLAISSQVAATESVRVNPNRDVFFKAVEQSGFAFVPSNWYGFNPVNEMKKTAIYYKGKLTR